MDGRAGREGVVPSKGEEKAPRQMLMLSKHRAALETGSIRTKTD